MSRLIELIIIILLFSACTPNAEKKREDKVYFLLNKIVSDNLTVQQKLIMLNTSNILDSLDLNQKKKVVNTLAKTQGWVKDPDCSEQQQDSIMLNANIKDFLRIYWHFLELRKDTIPKD